MNSSELIQFSKELVGRAEGVALASDEIADYAEKSLNETPKISLCVVNELIMRCAVDPGISVAPGHERFGEPSIILAESNEWVVELLSWGKMVTAIHEHSNCGAFRTLDGLRLQMVFEFEEDPAILSDGTVRLGDLRCVKSEILIPGTTTKVLRRRNFIHGVWPIDNQAATLVFRRRGPNDSWSYLPKKMTYDSRFAERYLDARIRYLVDLSKYSMNLYAKALEEIFEKAPLAACIHLIPALGIAQGDEIFEKIVSICERRDRPFADALLNVVENDQLFRSIFQLRRSATTSDQHKVLAFMFYSKIIDERSALELMEILGLPSSIMA